MIHLSDAALQDFIIRGYRLVQPTATADLHGELHRQVERVLATGNPGNDLIERVPLLHQLFADPAVDAALTGILGPGYALHRHCHCHDLAPGNQAQAWHKDYPFGGNVRYHRPRYALTAVLSARGDAGYGAYGAGARDSVLYGWPRR